MNDDHPLYPSQILSRLEDTLRDWELIDHDTMHSSIVYYGLLEYWEEDDRS